MAVEKKENTPTPETLTQMRDAALVRIGELWDQHIGEAMSLLEEAEEPKIRLNFGTVLNFTESIPKMKTGIRFTRSTTDERDDEFDPNQTTMEDLEKEAEQNTREGKKVSPKKD
jgi:hypothetical protein